VFNVIEKLENLYFLVGHFFKGNLMQVGDEDPKVTQIILRTNIQGRVGSVRKNGQP